MKNRFMTMTAGALAVSVLLAGGVMGAETEAEIPVNVDGVVSILANAHVGDLGEAVTSYEITLEDASAYADAAADSFTVDGSSEGVSFEVKDNVITLTVPDVILSSAVVLNEGTGLCFTKAEVTEIADPDTAAFDVCSYTGENGMEINYRLRASASEKQPLVIALHGAGECGSDNEVQITGNRGAVAWADYTKDATILAPQYPEKYTTPFEEGQEEIMTAFLETLTEIVNSLIEDGIVDENRIYLSGISMGGGLSWEYAARYPDMFAGIVTFSTRGTIAEVLDNMDRLEDIKTIPCWLFHAAGDIVNPTLNSLDLYKGMTALGNENAHLSIYDALDAEMQGLFIHFSWVAGLNTTSMMDWMFEQSRA